MLSSRVAVAPGQPLYDAGCQACPRLAHYLADSKAKYPDHVCRPVPAFGDEKPWLLIAGLAPGLHGANRTGRPFTGDFAGVLLYETLFRLGLSNQPDGKSADDGLRLSGVRITNAVKCVPPQNKPDNAEIRRCNAYLAAEIAALPHLKVILALGRIAHDAVLMALGRKRTAAGFGHGAEHFIDGRYLIDSYHCSRYNTQTRRLTAEMFRTVMSRAVELGHV
ncbi:MAG TPA: uracil-DNA glycosylase [Steroidobacteraceae bacterium]|nr:uracil-DNA glycosylase [Steroidobacteraceae bacterium]